MWTCRCSTPRQRASTGHLDAVEAYLECEKVAVAGRHGRRVWPPSTLIVWAVTNPAPSLARKAMTGPMSFSTSPIRRIGICATSFSSTPGRESMKSRALSVTMVGTTTFTVIP